MVCTVSPHVANHQESINTLRFGICAGGVRNDTKINVKDVARLPSAKEAMAELERHEKERDRLLTEVARQREEIERNEERIQGKRREIEAVDAACREAREARERIREMKKEKEEVLRKGNEEMER